MICKPEMARPLTIKDIEDLEKLIEEKGLDGVIRMYDIMHTKFGSGYAGWAKGVAA